MTDRKSHNTWKQVVYSRLIASTGFAPETYRERGRESERGTGERNDGRIREKRK